MFKKIFETSPPITPQEALGKALLKNSLEDIQSSLDQGADINGFYYKPWKPTKNKKGENQGN